MKHLSKNLGNGIVTHILGGREGFLTLESGISKGTEFDHIEHINMVLEDHADSLNNLDHRLRQVENHEFKDLILLAFIFEEGEKNF